jgi:hypothetical protein
LAYTPNPNRATNVPVTVEHREGKTVVRVDQKRKPAIESRFVSLGTFEFEAGDRTVAVVTNDATDGFVVVDAIQLLPE